MTPRFPKPLAAGDLIAITAPSSGVIERFHPRLERAIDALRERGYRVVEGQCLRAQHKGASAPRAQRARELMGFLTNPEVAVVMPPWGGELAMELLPLLDFRALAELPPKWLCGFSDISTLLLPLTTLSGWATLHGPNLLQFGWSDTDATTAAMWDALSAGPDAAFEQRASRQHQSKDAGWREDGRGPSLDAITQWKRLDGSDADLMLKGRLIGGCLDTISRLAGTPYGNVPAFIASSARDGTLLYLENAEMKPFDLARALLSVRLCGWFEGVSGILIGRSAGPDHTHADGFTYLDALQAALGDVHCPVVYDMDIGHVPPQLSLINGAVAELTLRDGEGTVVQTARSSASE